MAMAGTGLRERKKAETRRAIARAALVLAIDRGPDAVTVEHIAVSADVSPRTVFNYFATKEEAILGFDPDRSRELGRLVAERPSKESPLAALRAAFLDIAEANPEIAETARLRSQLVADYPHLHPRYVAAFSTLEHALVAAVCERTGLDPARSLYPRLVVSTAIAAFRVALGHAAGELDVIGEINAAFDALASGLRAPR